MGFQKKNFAGAIPLGKRGGAGAVIMMVLAGVVLVAACYYASGLKGSKEIKNDYYATNVDGEKAQQFLREAENLENKFNSLHEFKKNKITNEDIDIYDKAIIAYEKYLIYSGIDKRVNPHADNMRRKLHNMRADKIRENTTVLEGEAEQLATEGKYAEAEKLFAEAATQERRINTQFALSLKNNHARTIRLQNRALAMQAIPLNARAAELETDGRKALDARNWARANLKFQEAMKLRQRLWADYRTVISTGTNHIATLNTLIETANSAVDFEEERRLSALAEKAEKDGDFDAAAKFWNAALERQTLLERNFPRSEFASEERRQKLEFAVADAGARPEFLKLKKTVAEMQKKIRNREIAGVPILARSATVSAARILENFPTNSLVSQSLMRDLQYIDVKGLDIDSIQKAFFIALGEIPGTPATDALMMKREVSQAFYMFVTGKNPSANSANPLAPVESVNYLDAQEFCHRLSLLVGYEITLPTREQFMAAAGEVDENEISNYAWTLENSGGEIHVSGTRKANANGFFDLYGNVSEWIAQPKGAGKSEGVVLGGDCQFPAAMLAKEHEQKTLPAERSRLRGFRVVFNASKPISLIAE